MNLWEYVKNYSESEALTDSAMDCDSTVLNLAIHDLKKTFDGVSSLVEVGGGRGAFL